MAIVYAFCCLFFAALNDFVFKLYARKLRSRGIFVFWVGVCFFCLLLLLPRNPEADYAVTLTWGLLSGFFSAAGNILLIEAMGLQSAGLCSTIYRLNLVLVVPGAMLLFGERLSWLQGGGVLLALAAILAFMPQREKNAAANSAGKGSRLGFFLVLLAAALRAGMGLSYKYAFSHGADKNTLTQLNALMWIAGGLAYALLWEKKFAFAEKDVLRYGLLSGMLVSAIVFFMAGMLHLPEGAASVLLPIAQMSFLGTFVLGLVFLREKADRKQVLALLCGACALVLLVKG
ncbi:MAG: EamA family transporter [Lentisphaeria bacterium]